MITHMTAVTRDTKGSNRLIELLFALAVIAADILHLLLRTYTQYTHSKYCQRSQVNVFVVYVELSATGTGHEIRQNKPPTSVVGCGRWSDQSQSDD